MSIKEILKNLDNGILPDCLNYSVCTIDNKIEISKLQYNSFYRSYDFYASKYPKGMVENLPGFDKVLDYIVELKKDTTPIKELEEILKIQELEISNN